MSIYATWWYLDNDDHSEGCTGGEPCQCGPLKYLGSHVLPDDTDPREGNVEIAAIPGHIERTGRPALDEDAVWPWLRLSLNQEDVVLDWRSVLALYHQLGDWLARVQVEPTSADAPQDAWPTHDR